MRLAAVLAGGSGTRMGLAQPKQFLELAGRTVLEYSVEAFQRHPGIDRVLVVMQKDYVKFTQELVRQRGWGKVLAVIPGGATRGESSAAAVRFFADYAPEDWLLLHDGARPLVPAEVIDRVLAGLEHYAAVNVGLVPKDTVVQVNGAHEIVAIPERSQLVACQTPQGFHLGTIRRAYALAGQMPGFSATDDCSVVKQLLPEVPVLAVPGDWVNQKLTVPEDVAYFEQMLRERKDYGEADKQV